ncbi:transposase [Streptosporangium canum]|uniref:transposase n=1 Tax=Streptosporangium canum TaxID=324952 RepID=UPI0033AB754F
MRRFRTGSPWRGLPPGYGSWSTAYDRFRYPGVQRRKPSPSVDGEGFSEVGQCSLLTLTPVKAAVPYRVM